MKTVKAWAIRDPHTALQAKTWDNPKHASRALRDGREDGYYCKDARVIRVEIREISK